jgi:hypothetical protein
MSLEKKKDRVFFFRWRVWVDLRAFRLVTKNLRATLFRVHIEEKHVLRFLSLDEKSALSTRKARERLLLNENYK